MPILATWLQNVTKGTRPAARARAHNLAGGLSGFVSATRYRGRHGRHARCNGKG
jgi:hypothetical protein